MKTCGKCPKCASADTVRIPGRVKDAGRGNNIVTGFFSNDHVTVTRYLCSTCGYIEHWIDKPEDVAHLKREYTSWRMTSRGAALFLVAGFLISLCVSVVAAKPVSLFAVIAAVFFLLANIVLAFARH